MAAGSHVIVHEPESGLSGPAEMTEVDYASGLVYLDVDWGQLREHPARGWPFDTLAELVRLARLTVEAIRHHFTESSRQRVR